MKKEFSLKTVKREQMVDITPLIEEHLRQEGAASGVCTVFVPHTTAAVTVNENADPSVRKDLLRGLARIAPFSGEYEHAEGNSDAHIKASLVGPSLTVMVEDSRLVLGTWQSVFFCEFDGPRTRRFWVRIGA